jgi:hypothetical protein
MSKLIIILLCCLLIGCDDKPCEKGMHKECNNADFGIVTGNICVIEKECSCVKDQQ